jgi:hypothetical protein
MLVKEIALEHPSSFAGSVDSCNPLNDCENG